MDFFRLSKKDLITTQEWSIHGMNDINAVLEWPINYNQQNIFYVLSCHIEMKLI